MIALMLMMALACCSVQPDKEPLEKGEHVTVTIVYEKEGCTVYRIRDNDYYTSFYWSVCKGDQSGPPTASIALH